MKMVCSDKKPIKIGWQNLPRKRKKFARKLLTKVVNTVYKWEGLEDSI